MPCTVNFVGVPFTVSLSASLDEIQEWLQAESQSAKTLSDRSLECNSTSVIWRSPLTSTTEGMPELSATWSFILVVPIQVEVSRFFLFGVSDFLRKIRLALWGKVLCELSQHSLVHLRGWGHCLNEWLTRKQEKQSLLSATSFALSVGVFFLNIGHLHRGCFFFQATQFVGMFSVFAFPWFVEVVAEKTLEVVLVLVAVLGTFSSPLTLPEAVFIRSWASALSFSQSFKSINVGRSRLRFTVCIDHASFIFGGSFCTAWPSKDALDKSWT